MKPGVEDGTRRIPSLDTPRRLDALKHVTPHLYYKHNKVDGAIHTAFVPHIVILYKYV